MLNVWLSGLQNEAAVAMEEEVRVLKVRIFCHPAQAAIVLGTLCAPFDHMYSLRDLSCFREVYLSSQIVRKACY